MKSKTILIIIFIILGGIIAYYFSAKSPSKEGIVCGSTIPSRCHKYLCATGYFDPSRIPPGGGYTDGTNMCSDGSKATNLGEVEK